MADRATVITAPAPVTRTRAGTRGAVVATPVAPVAALTVSVTVRGTTTVFPAVTIAGALYVPAPGDDVTTVPLSDGRVLVLGVWSA